MLFVALRYSSHMNQLEKEQKKKEEKKSPSDDGDNSPTADRLGLDKEAPIGGELLTTEGGVPLA